jgi:hypothetical protein
VWLNVDPKLAHGVVSVTIGCLQSRSIAGIVRSGCYTVRLVVVADAELHFGSELRKEFSEKFIFVHLGSTV